MHDTIRKNSNQPIALSSTTYFFFIDIWEWISQAMLTGKDPEIRRIGTHSNLLVAVQDMCRELHAQRKQEFVDVHPSPDAVRIPTKCTVDTQRNERNWEGYAKKKREIWDILLWKASSSIEQTLTYLHDCQVGNGFQNNPSKPHPTLHGQGKHDQIPHAGKCTEGVPSCRQLPYLQRSKGCPRAAP